MDERAPRTAVSALRFRLLGFPVSVDPSFFLLAIFLGLGGRDFRLVAVWVGVVFVSILLHELGHAVAGRAFGLEPRIHLYSMGGLTSWRSARSLPHNRNIVISLAGPAAGFAMGLFILWLRSALPVRDSLLLWVAVQDLLWVNVGWGLVNLLPILPLDGGNVMRSVVQAYRGDHDERTPRLVSIVTGALICLFALWARVFWGAFLAGLFTFMNVAALKQQRLPRL